MGWFLVSSSSKLILKTLYLYNFTLFKQPGHTMIFYPINLDSFHGVSSTIYLNFMNFLCIFHHQLWVDRFSSHISLIYGPWWIYKCILSISDMWESVIFQLPFNLVISIMTSVCITTFLLGPIFHMFKIHFSLFFSF